MKVGDKINTPNFQGIIVKEDEFTIGVNFYSKEDEGREINFNILTKEFARKTFADGEWVLEEK